jgi:GNAT superfamily N-acetyltransferase
VGVGRPALDRLAPPALLQAGLDLSQFDSGEPVLDDWLRRRALSNQLSGASRSYVLLSEGQRLVGFYTLAAGAIAITEASGRLRRNMPDPIPMAVLGRLAVDRAWHGAGIGRLLLRDAVLRTCQAAETIGIRGLLVHALSTAAKTFYLHSGFTEAPRQPMTLMITLADARAALTAPG